MTVQADYWLTTQVAPPPPNDWVAIFVADDRLEIRDVAAVLLQSSETRQGTSARTALAVATFDGFLIPACDQGGFAGTLRRADYEAAAATSTNVDPDRAVGRRAGGGS